jgi:hypothetical protein
MKIVSKKQNQINVFKKVNKSFIVLHQKTISWLTSNFNLEIRILN